MPYLSSIFYTSRECFQSTFLPKKWVIHPRWLLLILLSNTDGCYCQLRQIEKSAFYILDDGISIIADLWFSVDYNPFAKGLAIHSTIDNGGYGFTR